MTTPKIIKIILLLLFLPILTGIIFYTNNGGFLDGFVFVALIEVICFVLIGFVGWIVHLLKSFKL